MICPTCGSDDVHKERIQRIIKERKIPFVCSECGMIKLPVRATLDRVLVWADPLPDTIGSAGLLFLPEIVKENYRNEYGTVLSIGPGYHDDHKSGNFRPTEIKIGDRVVYDKQVLYRMSLIDDSKKTHQITLMGEQDVFCIVGSES